MANVVPSRLIQLSRMVAKLQIRPEAESIHPRSARGSRERLRRTGILLAASVVFTGVSFVLPAGAATGTATGHGRTAGKTVSVSTQAQLGAAVDHAMPGTTIALHGGTYSGGLFIRRSGTASAPITMKPFGDGPVRLTANLTMPSCHASSPDTDRTVHIGGGASYWTIQGLQIVGGVYIAGDNAISAHRWFKHLMDTGQWQARRAVPGRGVYDRAAARNAIAYIAARIGSQLKPADGIKLLNDVVTRKGIQVTMSRYGVINQTDITDIACGTGPGIWFGTYSDGWTISHNTVSNVSSSTYAHYMQEGIRIDGASDYNLIQGNTVSDLPGDGRAFTTDQDASFDAFLHNTARNVSIGFNDQMSGWGNHWEYDAVTGYRDSGFAFRMMDSPLRLPSMNSSTYRATVRCNSATGTTGDLKIGASKDSTFSSNMFHTIDLSANLRSYWAAQGNKWNGSSAPPAGQTKGSLAGC
jgi:hypothetical protein